MVLLRVDLETLEHSFSLEIIGIGSANMVGLQV